MKEEEAKQDSAGDISPILVRKVARAFWAEDYLVKNPTLKYKDAYAAWKEVDKKTYQQTARKVLVRLARDGITMK